MNHPLGTIWHPFEGAGIYSFFKWVFSTTTCLSESLAFSRWFVDAVQKSTADWQIVVMPGHSFFAGWSLLGWTMAGWILKRRGTRLRNSSHFWVEFALNLCDDCTYISSFAANIRHLHFFIRNLMFSKWVTCLAKPAWGPRSTTSHFYGFNEWFNWMIPFFYIQKLLFHQTSIKTWLFGDPGFYVCIFIFVYVHQKIIIFLCLFFTMHDFLRELWCNESFPVVDGFDLFHQTNPGC